MRASFIRQDLPCLLSSAGPELVSVAPKRSRHAVCGMAVNGGKHQFSIFTSSLVLPAPKLTREYFI